MSRTRVLALGVQLGVQRCPDIVGSRSEAVRAASTSTSSAALHPEGVCFGTALPTDVRSIVLRPRAGRLMRVDPFEGVQVVSGAVSGGVRVAMTAAEETEAAAQALDQLPAR